MDPFTLAGQALSLLCGYFTQVASAVVQRGQDAAAEALYAVIATRLRGTELGARVLETLETTPGDAQARDHAHQELARQVAADPGYAAELDRAVRSVQYAQGTVTGSTMGNQFNVGTTGGSVTKSVVAGGNVDQSRTRISFGGLGVVAAVLLLGATGSIIAVTTGGSPDADSIGEGPGPEGIRETAEAYLGALRSGDTALLCDLHTFETVSALEAVAGKPCAETLAAGLERVPSELQAILNTAAVTEVKQTSDDSGKAAITHDDVSGGKVFSLDLDREMNRWRVGSGVDNLGVPGS